MPKVRHTNRRSFRNTDEIYKETLRKRGLRTIVQHETVEMRHPTAKQDRLLTKIEHVWAHGDKLWKLAQRHYGDASFWWVIAWYNLKPTDAHYSIGDRVLVPKPLKKILKFYGY